MQSKTHKNDLTTKDVPKGRFLDLPVRVSSESLWDDNKWIFEERSPGSCPSHRTISWTTVLPGVNERLTDPANENLLQFFRAFVWILLTEPDNATPLAPTRLTNMGGSIRMLSAFLIETGRANVGSLDQSAVEDYLRWLPDKLTLGAENTTRRGLSIYLDILTAIYKQNDRLEAYGFAAMPAPPFSHSRVKKRVARDMAGKEDGQYPVLPDDIAIPMMNAAYTWLGSRADDVIRMVDILYSIEAECAQSRKYLASRALVNEEFTFDGAAPWHQPLYEFSGENGSEIKAIGGLNELRKLFDLVITSCAIVIQFSSGMRCSELCGIDLNLTASDKYECITSRETQEGRYELFCLNGVLSKTEAVPERHEWVVGLRPTGSDIEIPAMRAVQVAADLTRHWRKISRSNRLFLQSARGFPLSSDSITGFTSAGYNRRLRKLLNIEKIETVFTPSFPIDTVGHVQRQNIDISSHMIRKLYANFAYTTNPRLVEALRVQYGHSSLAMTYQYTHNPNQVAAVDEAERALTLRRMTDLIHGDAVSGRAAAALDLDADFQRLKVEALTRGEHAWVETVKWVHKHDLRFHESAHGGCVNVAPSEMMCKKQYDRPDFLEDHRPNLAGRSAGTCVGCKNFIMMSAHKAFWFERYWSGKEFIEKSLAQGCDKAALRIVIDRTKQAEALLRGIGESLPVEGITSLELE